MKWIKQNNYEVKIIDKTLLLPKIDIKFHGKLREYQELAVNEMVNRYPVGVLEANTGAGKTVIATGIIAKRKQPTLIIVHSKELLYQWQEAIKTFLHYDCGLLGDRKNDIKDITVGIINTVKNKIDELTPRFGMVICDECFVKGTLIDEKPIEQIKIGDYVNSFNHKTNTVEKKKVLKRFERIEVLRKMGKWVDGVNTKVTGLPKTPTNVR
jgi:small basic protein (TIGR04137 family)